jgi:hypothetical protein
MRRRLIPVLILAEAFSAEFVTDFLDAAWRQWVQSASLIFTMPAAAVKQRLKAIPSRARTARMNVCPDTNLSRAGPHA